MDVDPHVRANVHDKVVRADPIAEQRKLAFEQSAPALIVISREWLKPERQQRARPQRNAHSRTWG